jgi:hypothetical protein
MPHEEFLELSLYCLGKFRKLLGFKMKAFAHTEQESKEGRNE